MRDALVTQRLRLSVFGLEDARDLHGLFSDPLTHTIGTGPFTSERETVAWIERRIQARRECGYAWYAIRSAEDGALIGNCGVFVGRTGEAEPEIGYEIKHGERGRGFAVEAAQAVVSELRTAAAGRLWATVRPSNHASLRVCARLGFEHDHIESDGRGELLYLVRELR